MVSITQFTGISAPNAIFFKDVIKSANWTGRVATTFQEEDGMIFGGHMLLSISSSKLGTYDVGVVPLCLERQSKSYPIGDFSKFSTQSPEYQDLDVTPRLSTGKVERPCHHEKLDGIAYVPSTFISYRDMRMGGSYGGTEFIGTARGHFLHHGSRLILVEGIQEYHYGNRYQSHASVTWSATTSRLTYKFWHEEEGRPTTYQLIESVQMNVSTVRASSGTLFLKGLDYLSNSKTTLMALSYSWAFSRAWSYHDDPVELDVTRALIYEYFQNVATSNRAWESSLVDRTWAFWSDGVDLRGGVNINMIENLSDVDFDRIRRLPHLLKMMKSRREIKRIPRTLKGVVQTLAGSYLSTKYGLCNTLRDIDSFLSYVRENGLSLTRQPKSVFRASKPIQIGDFSGHLNTKTCLIPKPDVPDHELTDLFGLELSPTQLWEVVPYSFAIDWIIQIGDFISRSDARALAIYRYDLEYQLRSYKLSKAIRHKEDLFSFEGSYTVYDRCIATTFPATDPTVTTDNKLFDHIIEAGCLLVNSIK